MFTKLLKALLFVIVLSTSLAIACPPPLPTTPDDSSGDLADTTSPEDPNSNNAETDKKGTDCGDPVMIKDGNFTYHKTDLYWRGRTMDVKISRCYDSKMAHMGLQHIDTEPLWDAYDQDEFFWHYYTLHLGYYAWPNTVTGYAATEIETGLPSTAYDIYTASYNEFTGVSSLYFYLKPEEVIKSVGVEVDYDFYYILFGESTFTMHTISDTNTHFYSYSASHGSNYGHGWDFNYNRKIIENGADLILCNGNNQRLNFVYNYSTGYYTQPKGYDYISTDASGHYILHKKQGETWTFDSNNKLSSISDRFGNSMTFTWSDGLLTRIYDDMGREFQLAYNSNRLLTSVTDPVGRTISYAYNSSRDLQTVTYPAAKAGEQQQVWTYGYNNGNYFHLLTSVTGPDNECWLENSYSGGKVVSQTWGDDDSEFDYQSGYTDYTNRRDNTTRFYYNDLGKVTREEVYDPCSVDSPFVTEYTYNTNYDLTEIEYPEGNSTSYTYDSSGNLLTIVRDPGDDDALLTTTLTYTSSYDLVDTVTDRLGNVYSFTYDFEDQQTYSTDDGALMKMTFPSVVVDGNSVSPEYSFTYNSYSQIDTVTTPENIVIKYDYYTDTNDPNNYGKLHTLTYDYGTGQDNLNIAVEYEYDEYGNLSKYTDPTDIDIVLDYDALNRLREIQTDLGYITKLGYNSRNKLTKIQRQLGSTFDEDTAQTVELGYGVLSRLQTVTNSLGNVSEAEYNENGYVDNVMDPEGRDAATQYGTSYSHDARDLLTMVTDAEGGETEYEYDKNGNVIKAIDSKDQETLYSYDGYDRLDTITFEDDTTIQYTYDKNYNLIADKKRDDSVIYYSYNALGWRTGKAKETPVTLDDGDTGTSSTGTWQTLSDSNSIDDDALYTTTSGATYTYQKTLSGQKMVIIRWAGFADSSDSVEVKIYDDTTLLDTIDLDQRYNHDRWVSLGAYEFSSTAKVEITSGSTGTTSVDAVGFVSTTIYEYDVMGRLTCADEGSASTYSNSFDRAGNLESCTEVLNYTVSYEYDDAGRATKLTYPDNSYITYHYDGMGRLTDIKDDSATPVTIVHYNYDELSRRTSQNYANGASILYDYTDANSLIDDDLGNEFESVFNDFVSSSDLWYEYTYDKAGNKRSKLVNGTDLTEYDYDLTYKLTEADYPGTDITTFNYDILGNRTSVVENGTTDSYTTNSLNQYVYRTTNLGRSVSYDDNGNLRYASIIGTMEYDSENRLTSIDAVSGADLYYFYDYAGRRIRKDEVYSDLGTYYIYDGAQVIAEYEYDSSSYVLARKFVYGPGIDEPVAMIVVDGETETWYYYHYDALGNVVALSKAGNLIERYTYTVFGIPSTYDWNGTYTGKASSLGNPYMFTGRRYDSETGLYYYRARMYSAEIGRFLQTDPIGYYDSMNLYQYCFNNPTNYVDPWGLYGTYSVNPYDDYSSDPVAEALKYLLDTDNAIGTFIRGYINKYDPTNIGESLSREQDRRHEKDQDEKDAERDARFEAMQKRQDAIEKENKELKERVEKLEEEKKKNNGGDKCPSDGNGGSSGAGGTPMGGYPMPY